MRSFMLFLIGLTFGVAGGFIYAAGNGITLDGHDHTDSGQHGAIDHGGNDHAKMHDQPLELDASDAPTLEIAVTKDPVTGHNLHVMTDNFTFSPLNAGRDHVPGEGHAHVYANGVKLGRLYGGWMHLENLPQGTVEISVTLNSNDHRQLSVGGQPVTASQTITNN